jgi:hypothetical protein
MYVLCFPPILDARWTTGGREVGSTSWLDLSSNGRRACEEPNEDLWCLMSDVWLRYAENRETDDIQGFVERISCRLFAVQKDRVHRTKPTELLRSPHWSHHIWATRRPLPNSGQKQHPCRISSHSSTRRHSLGAPPQARAGWPFSRGPWVTENGQHSSAPFGPFRRSEIRWYFRLFSTFSFKDLLFEFLSLTVKVPLFDW